MNQKPISIIINETQLSLINACNNSGLPACILEPIVKDLHDEIKHLSAIQLNQDMENYAKTQKDAQNSSDEQETEQ